MKKILVVVDMQNDFVDASLGSKDAIAIVENVVNKINTWEGEIVVTRDTHTKDYLNTREGKFLPVEHCIKGTDGWELNPKVTKALENKHAYFIDKPTFGSTELVELVKEIAKKDEVEVELIGLCTDICVVSNAMLLKAYYPEMNIYVDAKCCAGVSKESHDAALMTMKSCQIEILNDGE